MSTDEFDDFFLFESFIHFFFLSGPDAMVEIIYGMD